MIESSCQYVKHQELRAYKSGKAHPEEKPMVQGMMRSFTPQTQGGFFPQGEAEGEKFISPANFCIRLEVYCFKQTWQADTGQSNLLAMSATQLAPKVSWRLFQ